MVIAQAMAMMPLQWTTEAGLIRVEIDPTDADSERRRAVDALSSGLIVSQYENSNVVSVSFTSSSPRLSEQVANKATELYVDAQESGKITHIDRIANWMSQRLEDVRKQLLEAETNVERFKAANNLADAAPGESLSDQELADLNKTLTVARSQLAEHETRLKLLRDIRQRNGNLNALIDIVADPHQST